MDTARAMVISMLDAIAPVESGTKVVLGGFSQGAMLACDVVIRTDRPFAGLAMLSGTLVAQPKWGPLAAKRKGLRTVVSHGQSDAILPFSGAEKLRDFLQQAGLDVTWVPFRGGHEIPPPALDGLAELVRNASA